MREFLHYCWVGFAGLTVLSFAGVPIFSYAFLVSPSISIHDQKQRQRHSLEVEERVKVKPPATQKLTTATAATQWSGPALVRQRTDSVRLFSGTGIAKGYTWQEEAFEIDVTVKVPKDTRVKDIQFHATSRSIDLRLRKSSDDAMDDGYQVLLDGNRTLRGRVSLDGTYWVIGDVTQDENMYLSSPYREVTVTIEKLIRTPKDDFEVVNYDWNGLYIDDDEEVVSRKYDGPEELDVKEYAASIGVDLDNLNMSMVDKSMFSSNLNVTQSSLDELKKAGLVKEVTQQADGSEFIVDPETGEPQQVHSTAEDEDGPTSSTQPKHETLSATTKKIPFLDTNSPWHNAVPVNQTNLMRSKNTIENSNDMLTDRESRKTSDATNLDEDVVQQKRYFTRAAFAEDAAAVSAVRRQKQQQQNIMAESEEDEDNDDDEEEDVEAKPGMASDPIDLLTVKKLKEILKSQGLKVSGNKKELQDRLRQQVNSLLQGKQRP